MPRRHVFRHVRYVGPTRPSARLLDRGLAEAGYTGDVILWGSRNYSAHGALLRMRHEGVSVPELYSPSEANSLLDEQGGLPDWPDCVQVIGRTSNHRAGSGFWFCTNKFQVNAAADAGASHFLRYIADAREFRVHVVDGKSIKLTEKLYDMEANELRDPHPYNDVVRSHHNGWLQKAPRPDAHRVSLRTAAKAACAAVGASFGAVDILLKNGRPYVLEVNTAPALTDPGTDTLARYVRAFTARSQA